MAQVIPQFDLGERIGKSLGTGIEQGLNTLAQFKLNELMRRQSSEMSKEMLTGQTRGMNLSQEEVDFANIFPYGSKEQLHALQMIAERNQPVEQQMINKLNQPGLVNQQTPNVNAMLGMPGLQQTIPQTSTMRGAIASGLMTPQMKQEERHFSTKMAAQAFKETAKVREGILKGKQSADNDIAQLNKLQRLSDSGKLPNDILYKFLDRIGLSDVGSLIGADAQEFNKIITDMTSKIKDKYGARVTNFELGTFLRGLPSLLQTKEGRNQVIQDLTALAKIPQERFNMMQKIKAENNGIPPLDLGERIESNIEDYKNSIFNKYKQFESEFPQHNVVKTVKSLPPASSSKGQVIQFPDGTIKASDGMRWRPVEIKGNEVNWLPEEDLM